MTENGSLKDHLAVFKIIISNFEILNVKYDEEDLALIILCSLPDLLTLIRDTIFCIVVILLSLKMHMTSCSQKKKR